MLRVVAIARGSLAEPYARPMLERDLDPDPIAPIRGWLEAAHEAGLGPPDRCCWRRRPRTGAPSARMVLLKSVGRTGFVFYTNRRSRKGRELAANPRAALVLYWEALGRQVRVEGTVEEVGDAESAAYWATRPLGSRISASGVAAERGGREPRLARGCASPSWPQRYGRPAAAAALGRVPRDRRGRRALAAPRRPPARPRPLHARRRRLAQRAPGAVRALARLNLARPLPRRRARRAGGPRPLGDRRVRGHCRRARRRGASSASSRSSGRSSSRRRRTGASRDPARFGLELVIFAAATAALLDAGYVVPAIVYAPLAVVTAALVCESGPSPSS